MNPLFACTACGAAGGDLPFRCPAADGRDDLDHVLSRRIDPGRDAESGFGRVQEAPGGATDANPIERYRHRLSFWAFGRAHGLDDAVLVEMVQQLDRRVAEVDGRGFLVTPFRLHPALGAEVSAAGAPRVWVKDETGNVSGSHKGRHLAGVMLHLQVAERLGVLTGRPPLAIASCGNAALAAGVIARAASWPLRVFVPPSAHPAVLARLEQLGACITTCRRPPGVGGDPCYHAFRAAIADGAVPFCCQGSDNALTIEGGETLAWEMIDALGGASLDAVFVQVGGGALASATVQGLERAHRAGAIARLPRIYAVQTAGGYPLARAYDRVVARMADGFGPAEAMSYARSHRSQFMWPWEEEPRSVAHGILDDETYDWAAVVEGMLATGGRPAVVGERRLEQANAVAREITGIDVDHTGSAGLAGLIEALEQGAPLRHARVAVIFSGVQR
jgi:threonine synthase